MNGFIKRGNRFFGERGQRIIRTPHAKASLCRRAKARASKGDFGCVRAGRDNPELCRGGFVIKRVSGMIASAGFARRGEARSETREPHKRRSQKEIGRRSHRCLTGVGRCGDVREVTCQGDARASASEYDAGEFAGMCAAGGRTQDTGFDFPCGILKGVYGEVCQSRAEFETRVFETYGVIGDGSARRERH